MVEVSQFKAKTAHHDEGEEENKSTQTVMSGDLPDVIKVIDATAKQQVEGEGVGEARQVGSSTPPLAAASSSPGAGQCGVDSVSLGGVTNDKSDSEAETVVLSEKDEAPADKARKVIEHETGQEIQPKSNGKVDRVESLEKKQSKKVVINGGIRPSLKRKRVVQEAVAAEAAEAANSSNLSSTISSPVPDAHSSRRSGSESGRSRSSPPDDEVSRQKDSRLRKRRREHGTDDHARQERGKSDPSSEKANTKERRGTRSATHDEVPVHRSESPPVRVHKRAKSSQSNISETQGGPKRRKGPPPILVDQRRKASEDAHGDSDDSSSVHSHLYPQKFSADHNAMSLAKFSHKKNRDKNGRTLLARACAIDEMEAEVRLKERPQDMNIPDNAGNTPLQIASLEGKSKIVQLLLDAGCDITCKNTDMETPLIDAVENGHLDVVRMLLKAGLDPRQSNAKGEEPLDLVNSENNHYDAIRAALISAKEKDKPRRSSEDQNSHHNAGQRDNDTSSMGASAASPTESLPVHGTRSPPPSLGLRRRTARSQPTRDGLLWVNATPANLRDAAGKGDLTIVDHILKMRPDANSESVLAAARGGHDVVIELLIAIGKPDPDPEPLRSSDYKPAYSTPMLAAIGRGNVKVIELLLSQPGFDPTRRLYRGLTYYELAKERQSPEWQEEHNILKKAYDNHVVHKAKKLNHGSPRKVRVKRPEPHKSSSETSSSPLSVGKLQNSQSPVLEDSKVEKKRDSTHKTAFHKHLRVPKVENRDLPATSSDRESEPLGPPKPKPKSARSVSDVGSGGSRQGGLFKPRRKLLSRNDMKSDQDIKRRASLAEASSASSQENLRQKSSNSSRSASRVKKEASSEPVIAKTEVGRKRSRISVSPQASVHEGGKASEIVKKKKRRRVDSEGSAIAHDHQRQLQPGPAMVANMIASPEPVASPTITPGAAPVAFMGASVASPIKSPKLKSPVLKSPATKSPVSKPPIPKSLVIDAQIATDTSSSASGIDQALQQNIQQDLKEQRQVEESLILEQDLEKKSDNRSSREEEKEREMQKEKDKEREKEREEERDKEREREKENEKEKEYEMEREKEKEKEKEIAIEKARKESDRQKQELEAEEAKKIQAAIDEAEEKSRIARQEEESRLESQRQAKEAERQLQIEREEEEARAAKKKKEDELQRRRAEQEKVRKEEQERRRAEVEERERLRRIRIQEEEEQQRRKALPNALRRAAELSPDEARELKEITKWLPLHTVTTRELDAGCEEQIADERWIANCQAAPILAITDLDLSQCKLPSILICLSHALVLWSTHQTSVFSTRLLPTLSSLPPYLNYMS